jgi:hypothetical protein
MLINNINNINKFSTLILSSIFMVKEEFQFRNLFLKINIFINLKNIIKIILSFTIPFQKEK